MKTLAVITLVVFACSVMFAQSLPKSLSTGAGSAWGSRGLAPLANCSGCADYTGDFDPFGANANGLWNANSVGNGIVGQTWVSATATSDGNPLVNKHFAVTSITFNELITGTTGLTGGTYVFAKSMSTGQGGIQPLAKACKSLAANFTGTTGFGFPEYSLVCTLKVPFKMAIGTQYFVNVLPKWTGTGFGYLADMQDTPSSSQFGWGDTLYNSFFNSAFFGYTYQPTGTLSGSGCGGVGCDEFSIGFSGSYVP